VGFLEHPLDGAVEQDGVWQVGDLAVEPQMDAGDGRAFEFLDGGGEVATGGVVGEELRDGEVRNGEDAEVEVFGGGVGGDGDGPLCRKGFLDCAALRSECLIV
jgi:hypothetical protein